jgi:flagellar biosynthesis/type III secretory pathway chaperone
MLQLNNNKISQLCGGLKVTVFKITATVIQKKKKLERIPLEEEIILYKPKMFDISIRASRLRSNTVNVKKKNKQNKTCFDKQFQTYMFNKELKLNYEKKTVSDSYGCKSQQANA